MARRYRHPGLFITGVGISVLVYVLLTAITSARTDLTTYSLI
jgi:hypothetical protein